MADAPKDHVALELAMFEYDRLDPKRIQHFVKVHALAHTIALAEGMDPAQRYVVEAAALVHDIGIHESERIYGDSVGTHQEELGPKEARPMMERLGYAPEVIDRVCWLVAHHHHYNDIQDDDLQVLIEADMLVNVYEDSEDDVDARRRMAESLRERVFRTKTGIKLLEAQFI
ncbi:MAG: HD domain-containing protein [Olsenella sp.]|jgi:HD superfamily phosphodiesterase|nr:HD domain-containing protein [Olsenella sp.]MCI1288567.1 HD domain-containing protein [Olsenella sp.]